MASTPPPPKPTGFQIAPIPANHLRAQRHHRLSDSFGLGPEALVDHLMMGGAGGTDDGQSASLKTAPTAAPACRGRRPSPDRGEPGADELRPRPISVSPQSTRSAPTTRPSCPSLLVCSLITRTLARRRTSTPVARTRTCPSRRPTQTTPTSSPPPLRMAKGHRAKEDPSDGRLLRFTRVCAMEEDPRTRLRSRCLATGARARR